MGPPSSMEAGHNSQLANKSTWIQESHGGHKSPLRSAPAPSDLPAPPLRFWFIVVTSFAASATPAMGWSSALFGFFGRRLMKSSDSSSSTSNPPPVFAVGSTEVLLADDVPELTVREINRATLSFSHARLIGCEHNYATVYRAVLPGGVAAAAKRLEAPPSGFWDATEDAFLRQQVSVLSMVGQHDNIVRLLGYTIAADLRVLLFELPTVGTLHDFLHGRPTAAEPQPGSSRSIRPAPALSWAQRTRIALDAARGLQHLHEAASASHWGIRSSTVLLFQGLKAKIAEYDIFEQLPRHRDKRAGMAGIFQIQYLPPEYVCSGRAIGHKVDVYSFGVVLLELLTGRPPRDLTTLDHPYYSLVHWAIPLLRRKGGVERCIDPKLGTQYPPAGALELGRTAKFPAIHGSRRPNDQRHRRRD